MVPVSFPGLISSDATRAIFIAPPFLFRLCLEWLCSIFLAVKLIAVLCGCRSGGGGVETEGQRDHMCSSHRQCGHDIDA